MYERSRSSRDRRDRVYDDDDVLMSAVGDDDYYRSRSHRDQVHPSSSRSHHRETVSPHAERHYVEDDRPRGTRARSPYASDDRWTPRDKVVPSAHSNYSTAPYDRPLEEGYARRTTTDEHYRQVAYPDDAWSSHHPVKDRDNYGTTASSGYHSWDRTSSYGHPLERDERTRQHHVPPPAALPRHVYEWPEEDRLEPLVEPTPEDREWTRRRDDRAWTRDDGHSAREEVLRTTTRGWEQPRAAYPPEPVTKKSSEPKFAPGPGWKGDDIGPLNRNNHRNAWKNKGPFEGKKKDKEYAVNNRRPKGTDAEIRPHDNGYQSRKSNGRGHGPSKSDRKSHKRRRSTSRSPSRSRSRSRSASPHSHVAPSVIATPKRRRKGSSSPDRHVDRDGKKSSKGVRKIRSPSPKWPRTEDERGRGAHRTSSNFSRSRSVGRSRTRSASPVPPRSKSKRLDDAIPGKRRDRSRSTSRSRSPSSSPQASLKTNGANGAGVKHRLPPSGPRPADFVQARLQPVASTFVATGRSAVAAAYQRRNQLVGEPPPGPRADFAPGPSYAPVHPPAAPKGMYPPPLQVAPIPSHVLTRSLTSQTSAPAPTMVPAAFLPIAPRSAVVGAAPLASTALVKQFFPGDDDDPERTPAEDDSRGGGKGFGIIPARSKHPSGRARSSPGVYPPPHAPRASSPAQYSRPSASTSPFAPVSNRTTQETLVSQSQHRASSPRSEEHSLHQAMEQSNMDPSRQQPAPTEVYQLVNQVGEGTFGKVYKAKNVVSGAMVALKRIKVEAEKDGFPVTALREIKLLQSLSNRNVVSLHEMMISKGNVYMVFEYMEHDLTGVLSQTQFSFSEGHLKSLCYQMLTGLEYLHHKGVVHRDMKGSNILVNSRGELKLADFGLARVFQKRRKNDYTNRVITLWYRPPELLLGATVYGPEVDMWSAGTIMLELFTKKAAFPGNDEIHQLEVIYDTLGTPTPEQWPGLADTPWYELVKPKQIRQNNLRTIFSKCLSPAALDLVEGLLTYDPEKRFTAAHALQAPYFLIENPEMELPIGLAAVDGEWHELETKREKEKVRKRRKNEGSTAANGQEPSSSIANGATVKPAPS